MEASKKTVSNAMRTVNSIPQKRNPAALGGFLKANTKRM
jgi:hypothetical protein